MIRFQFTRVKFYFNSNIFYSISSFLLFNINRRGTTIFQSLIWNFPTKNQSATQKYFSRSSSTALHTIQVEEEKQYLIWQERRKFFYVRVKTIDERWGGGLLFIGLLVVFDFGRIRFFTSRFRVDGKFLFLEIDWTLRGVRLVGAGTTIVTTIDGCWEGYKHFTTAETLFLRVTWKAENKNGHMRY